MTDQPHSLSEISHLFLSGMRAKQQASGAGPRPMRIPPAQRPEMTIDLTPEEFAHVFGEEKEKPGAAIGPVRAVLASHLGAAQLARVQEYASRICAPGQRIGLIAVDASEFRLSIFEHNPHSQPQAHRAHDAQILDPRRMSEALEELAWDVDTWLLLLPSPRAPEARSLLRDVNHWTILSGCDHESVVACYRTLKGLSDLHRPRLSLATTSDADSGSAHQRLAGVCRQFLDWPLEREMFTASEGKAAEHIVLWCCGTRDKAQLAAAPQWQIVADFLDRARKSRSTATAKPAESAEAIQLPQTKDSMNPSAAAEVSSFSESSEVIDLPGDASSASAVVSAVLRGGHDLVECPVKPPMCPEASLAVSREHRLVLVAVARQGLCDLRDIGRAYQWLIENRPLIGMAVPQMAIDAHQMPQLHLLVDHADMSADVLQPILHSDSVTVHAYRKLRWAGKTGLLLEAA